jgi:hypothetical protein
MKNISFSYAEEIEMRIRYIKSLYDLGQHRHATLLAQSLVQECTLNVFSNQTSDISPVAFVKSATLLGTILFEQKLEQPSKIMKMLKQAEARVSASAKFPELYFQLALLEAEIFRSSRDFILSRECLEKQNQIAKLKHEIAMFEQIQSNFSGKDSKYFSSIVIFLN